MAQIRPTTAHVNLDALGHNLRAIRGVLHRSAGVLAAIKGDAYGHGAVQCAVRLQDDGVDWFGVALVEEGRQLREAGISRPILCLAGVGPAGAEACLEHHLTPVVSDLEDAERIDTAAAKRHQPFGVHLKIDTGMGRMGVPAFHWEGFLDRVAELRWLRVDGICSHLAESEDAEAGVFTVEQGRRFLSAVQAARARGIRPSMLHLANSGAILSHPDFTFDLVRPGLMLYGYRPDGPRTDGDGPVLKPVMSISTRVLVVRDLPAGVGVSYGRTWTTDRPSRIATLPVGYADGYPRALSGKAEVLIHGHRAPVRGRVCMDLCMVDVTDVPVAVEAGDEVVLLGQQGEDQITAWDLADWADTIAYEILAGFSTRVPRTVT